MTPADLYELRSRLGLTQAGLGAAVGMSRDSIASYECGRRPIPRVVEVALGAVVRAHREQQLTVRVTVDGEVVEQSFKTLQARDSFIVHALAAGASVELVKERKT